MAQSLQTRRTNIIGLVVASIGDPFFSDLLKGVEEVARPAGFSVFLNSSRNDPDQEIQVIETFHRQRVDGILLELGHRRIAYIGVTNRPKSNTRRLRGYLDALEAAGIDPDPAWVHVVDLDPTLEDSDGLAGKQAARQLLDTDATAVFCYNDMVAVGALLERKPVANQIIEPIVMRRQSTAPFKVSR